MEGVMEIQHCKNCSVPISKMAAMAAFLKFFNRSLTIPNLVPQRPFCYLNFISVAKTQNIGNETYDVHVLASSKTYRKQNKPKKWIPNPLRYMSF